MKLDKILAFIILALSVILALTPFHLAPVCTQLMPNGGHMSCYYSAWFLIGIAVLAFLLAGVIFLSKKKLWRTISFFGILVLAVLGYAVPHRLIAIGHMKMQGWQIGMCMAPDMACRVNTFPVATALLAFLGVIGVMGLTLHFLSDKSK